MTGRYPATGRTVAMDHGHGRLSRHLRAATRSTGGHPHRAHRRCFPQVDLLVRGAWHPSH
jgi:hypothetical protein